MHKYFPELDKLLPLHSTKELFRFWLEIIEYRKHHKDDSRHLGHYAFVNTNHYTAEEGLNSISFEFGALEAPGWPPEEMHMTPKTYEDFLWQRLEDIIVSAKQEEWT